MKTIYLDNAATTKPVPEVIEAMLPYYKDYYGNASSLYSLGQESKQSITKARSEIAECIGAKANEIYFTSGGSEADNWALKAAAEAYSNKGKHIITTKIEHHAILHTCEYLEKHGYDVTYLNVDEFGMIDLKELKSAIRPDTILISVMFANNEIGTIQPIKEIGKIAKEHKILFHTDAVQAFGQVAINVDELYIDMLSSSAHKIHGPKGVGFLYIRNSVKLPSFIHGGAQERWLRAGTENVPGIVGYAKAAKIAVETINKITTYEMSLKYHLIQRISSEIPDAKLNGPVTNRLPNNANFSFKGVRGESVLTLLDMNGICVSTGSACNSSSAEPSHVLKAIGLSDDEANGSIRITLSEENTREEIDFVVDVLKRTIEQLRELSK